MTKLAKYLKPFLVGLTVAILLLVAQALADLNLPNYMSDVVNVGIQQGGIENAAPEALSANAMQFVSIILSEGDRALVEGSYKSADAGDANYAGRYPNAEGEIFVRVPLGGDELGALDNALGRFSWTVINLFKGMGQSVQEAEDGVAGEASQEMPPIDLKQIYEMLPKDVSGANPLAAVILGNAREAAANTPDAMLRQSAMVFTRAFLEELGVDMAAVQRDYILRVGLLMLLIALAGGAATVAVSYLSSKVAAGFARNLRRAVFSKIESFSSSEYDQFSTASLITRCTNDITQVQMLITMGIRMICYAPIMVIGGVFMAVQKSPSMSWIIAMAGLLLIGLIIVIMTIAVPRFQLIQKLIDKLNLVSRETLSGQMVIRAFNAQSHEEQRFDGVNRELVGVNLFIGRLMSAMFPLVGLIMNGVSVLILWVGAHQIAASTMQVGDMMAFMQYAMQVIMSFMMISMMFVMVPRAAVSGKRIAEVLGTESRIHDPQHPVPFDAKKRGVVEFRNVNFRYPGAEEDALHDITFTALPGQTTAIIGPTGSGKSTIANLLLRFYDVTGGEVVADGADIRQVTQESLREKIGYVPQQGLLMSGTVASNLRYGNPAASDDEVARAAQVAQADGFVTEMEGGYEAAIAQGGTNVSGGQRQRLSIARALAKKPEVLLFDDSFSALDFKTDATLRAALRDNAGGETVIVVAQRVSTIMTAEQILVLEKGRVVGRGTHRELLANCPEYYEIASSQLAKEELA